MPTAFVWFLICFAALTLLSQYVWGPIALHTNFSVNTMSRCRTMTAADASRADPELLAYLERTEAVLMRQGFGPPHRIVATDKADMLGLASLLEHPGEGDLVIVMAIRSTAGPTTQVSAASTITNGGSNGMEVVTSNVSHIIRHPRRPGYDAVRLPAVTNLDELYAIHRFRTARLRRSGPTLALTRGATEEERLAYQDQETVRTYDFWVSRGEYYRTPTALRLTWKGAVYGVWRGLFPWRQLIEGRHKRYADKVLRDFAMTEG